MSGPMFALNDARVSGVPARGFLCFALTFDGLRSIQVDNLPGIANFEIDRSLAELLSHAREQLPRFIHAFERHQNLQAIAFLFVHSTIIRNPSTLEWTLHGIAAKRITDKIQDRALLAPANFRSIVSMGRYAGN